jgi:hypothetical protein
MAPAMSQIRCTKCRTINSVEYYQLARRPVCAMCKSPFRETFTIRLRRRLSNLPLRPILWPTLAACGIALAVAWFVWPRVEFDLPGVSVVVVRPPADSEVSRHWPTLPFDVGPDGVPLVAVDDGLWALGPSSATKILRVPFEAIPDPQVPEGLRNDTYESLQSFHIDDFAWADDALLYLGTITLGEFPQSSRIYGLVEGGAMKIVDSGLPSSPMSIRPAGPRAVYVYDDKSIYVVQMGGQVAKVANFETRIDSVTGDGRNTYVASDKTVYLIELALTSRSPRVVFETNCTIVSLIHVEQGGLFYATRCGIGYFDGRDRSRQFVRGAGGQLRIHSGALYVLLQTEPTILLLSPIDALMLK